MGIGERASEVLRAITGSNGDKKQESPEVARLRLREELIQAEQRLSNFIKMRSMDGARGASRTADDAREEELTNDVRRIRNQLAEIDPAFKQTP